MAPQKIGYARVAITNQSLDAQVAALKAAGCSEVFTDAGISGAALSRPGFQSALNGVAAGDTLVVMETNRISRSYSDVLEVVAQLADRGVELETLGHPDEATAIKSRAVEAKVRRAMTPFQRLTLFLPRWVLWFFTRT